MDGDGMTEEKDTSGFYKLDGALLYGHAHVWNAEYELHRDQRDDYDYPVQGWYWFDSESDARAFFGLPDVEDVEP